MCVPVICFVDDPYRKQNDMADAMDISGSQKNLIKVWGDEV